jgi:adenylosuccinate lyase
VREAEESFGKGQKGSSAMPHKKNPILSENVTGLCRLVRGYAQASLESVALWHERDISHSSVERVIAPDATLALDFALTRMTGLIDGLVFHPEQMRANLDLTRGLVYSGRLLVALVRDGGLSREEAYRLVQRNALAAFDQGDDFERRVRQDAEVTGRLGESALAGCFERAVGRVDVLFERVFGKEAT